MATFKYLDCILTSIDYSWPVVLANLMKARNKWVRMYRILRVEGVNARTSGNLIKEVVQSFLLFGSETWVVTPCVGK